MPFIEAVILELGSSISKSILKLWLKDHPIISDTSASITDILKLRTSDKIAQQRARRQFELIGEKVGESLMPIFEVEGASLDDASRIAVVQAAVETLNAVTSDVLVQQNIDPSNLAKYLLKVHPAEPYHFSQSEEFLYQRIVSESCERIVEIASQLPTFNETTFSEVLKRESQLIDITENILQEMQRLREQLNPDAKAAHFELDYRRAVIRTLDVLQLFGVDFQGSSRRHRLSVAYVTLSVERKAQSSAATRSQSYAPPSVELSRSNDKTHRSAISVDEVLAGSRRLLIRGLAGSGKTTLLQWIAVNSASQTFKDPLTDYNNTVPFLIRLRHCVQSGLPAPEDFPNFITNIITDTMPGGWVHAELTSGRAIVLVDGLDEIPIPQREDVRVWLNNLLAIYPKARYIVTTRPHAVEESWMIQEGFIDTELQPMEISDIRIFIDHWYNAVANELQDEQEKTRLLSFAKRLQEEIVINRAKRNLATSPLLCAMLCALNRERQTQLPSDRIELYEACCRMLIERRDAERGISLADYPAHILTYTQRYALLADLAYWLMKNGWSEIEVERADERFSRKLINMLGIQQGISGADVRRFLAERTSIIREPLVDHIDFTHRTFQEYLAARAVAEEGDIGVLIQQAHNDQWREVIILTPGCVNGKDREKLLLELIKRGDVEKEHRYHLHLLAVACLESAIQLEGPLKRDIEDRLSQIVPPKDMTDAQALAAAGELAVEHLSPKVGFSDSALAACVRTLGIIGGDASLEMLKSYIHSTSSIVIDELFRAWSSFEKKTYAQSILSKALQNGGTVPDHLSSLDGFQYFTDLTYLNLSSCKQISDFSQLANLNQLKSLNLSGCEQINNLDFLWSLTQLISLNLSHCNRITDFHPLMNLTQLASLDLSGCQQVRDLSPLDGLTQLTSLSLSNCEQVNDFSPLVELKKLTSLDLSKCRQIKDLNFLTHLEGLNSLDLSGCSLVQNFGPVANLASLTSLKLAECQLIDDLNPLTRLTSLISLDLSGCWRFSNLQPLANLSRLMHLNLSDCIRVSNLYPLADLTDMVSLNLSSCSRVYGLGPLANLTSLTSLHLSRCKQISDLAPLTKLIQLTFLDLAFCENVSDLEPLVSLAHLRSLNLSGCSQVRDLSALTELSSLQELILSENFDSSRIPKSIVDKVFPTGHGKVASLII
jgi:Leucine-rich repeat (LRR) protein